MSDPESAIKKAEAEPRGPNLALEKTHEEPQFTEGAMSEWD